jgi:hypothetical protein
MGKIRIRAMALLVALALVLAGALTWAQPASAVSLLSTPVTAGGNILGKPLPALDYAHAPVGIARSKGKLVPITAGHMTPKTACVGSACYHYSGAKQAVVSDASSIQFSVEQPTCNSTVCGHSLAENAVESADQKQIVEWGWTVDNSGVNGADHVKPHLFAFRWVNGVAGTYNGSGWVNAVSSPCPAGMDISADVSTGSATVQNFAWQHLNGAWWAAYKSSWCGAFPDSVWTGATPPVTFTQSGLIQVFGEMAAQTTVPTGAQMGSGVLGSITPTNAGARASSFALGTTVPAGVAPSLTILTNTEPTHYNAVLQSGTVRTFRYGGTY